MNRRRPPLSERLLAMIDALTDLTAVAMDVPQLANAIAQNVAQLDGATGAAVGSYAGERLEIVASNDADEAAFRLLERYGTPARADYDGEVPENELGIRSIIAAQLRARGERVGTLWVYSTRPHAFAGEDPELVWRFSKIVGPILDLSVQFNRKLYESRTDELTGLQNRRAFDERLCRRIAELERYGTPFSLVIADLDDFKAINDTHGHSAGDRVLAHVAEALRSRLRTGDEAFRIGGDEFALLLPSLDTAAAQALLDRVVIPGVSMSFGAAQAVREETASQLLERADKDLYASKHARTS